MGSQHCIGGGAISQTCVKQCYGLAILYKGKNNKQNLRQAMLWSSQHCIGGGIISKTCIKQCYTFATLYRETNNQLNLSQAMLYVRNIVQGDKQSVKLVSSNVMGSQHCIGGGTISSQDCIGGGKTSKTCAKQCYGLSTLYRVRNNK